MIGGSPMHKQMHWMWVQVLSPTKWGLNGKSIPSSCNRNKNPTLHDDAPWPKANALQMLLLPQNNWRADSGGSDSFITNRNQIFATGNWAPTLMFSGLKQFYNEGSPKLSLSLSLVHRAH